MTDTKADISKYIIIPLTDENVALTNLNSIKENIQSESASGNTHIALDLKEVTTINSSGLGILISCLKSIKENDGDMIILNANDKLKNIFKITKLDKVFKFSEKE